MTPEQYQTAIDDAGKEAGESDAGWNRRFVEALNRRGLRLVPFDDLPEYRILMLLLQNDSLLAPTPHNEGWRYEYPSIVVPR